MYVLLKYYMYLILPKCAHETNVRQYILRNHAQLENCMTMSQDSDVTTLDGAQSDISDAEQSSPSVLCPRGQSDSTTT